MKWSFKIFLFCALLSINKSKAQLDTLNYLKQFEASKNNYIGQPFSKLLNDITQIQPKTAWSSPSFKNKNYNFSTRFKFCNVEQSYFNVITLSIEWETPIPISSSEYYEQLHNFYFTNDEKSFYGSKIVKDIKVYR